MHVHTLAIAYGSHNCVEVNLPKPERLARQRYQALGTSGIQTAGAMSQVVVLPLAVPGTVIASLLGFHMLSVFQSQLRHLIKLVRGSDVEVNLLPRSTWAMNMLCMYIQGSARSFGCRF